MKGVKKLRLVYMNKRFKKLILMEVVFIQYPNEVGNLMNVIQLIFRRHNSIFKELVNFNIVVKRFYTVPNVKCLKFKKIVKILSLLRKTINTVSK